MLNEVIKRKIEEISHENFPQELDTHTRFKKVSNRFSFFKNWKTIQQNGVKFNSLKEALDEGKFIKKNDVCIIICFEIPQSLRKNLEEHLHNDNNTTIISNDTKLDFNKMKKPESSNIDDANLFFDNFDLNEKNAETYIKYITNTLHESINHNKLTSSSKQQLEKYFSLYVFEITTYIKNKFNNSNKGYLKGFDKIFVETYILFLINTINCLTGLNCLLYFDPFNILNLEFYANEPVYINCAEKENYPLQLKINSNLDLFCEAQFKIKLMKKFQTYIKEKDGHVKVDVTNDINHKNKTPFEFVNENDISFFPPYLRFNKQKIDFYRKYDKLDRFHECLSTEKREYSEETQNLINRETNCKEAECSIFRSIDKLRLLESSLTSIINFQNFKKLKFFHSLKYLRNDHGHEKVFDDSNFITNYFSLLDTPSVKRNNHFLRNYLGENISYYFLFVSHYIKWLLIPSLLGILMIILPRLISPILIFCHIIESSVTSSNGYKTLYNLFYMMGIIIWGCIYIKSWASNQKFYNYVWGMNEYDGKLNQSSEIEVNKFILYQGIVIPIQSRFKYLIKKLLSIVISIINILLTIFINLFLFYLSNREVYGNINYSITDNGGNFSYESFKNYLMHSNDDNKNNEIQSPTIYYLSLVFSVVVRNLISKLNYTVANWSCNIESHLRKEDYTDSFIVKVASFEFINYYFSFYYVAYIKQLFGNCANNSCFDELGSQLNVVLLTSNILNFLEIGLPFLKLIGRKNVFKKTIQENLKTTNFEENDPRITYYYKDEFDSNICYEYLEIVFSYGYVILFGVTSNICFIFALLNCFVERIVDSYKIVKLHNVNSIEGSRGIGVILKILKIFTFFGILTNTTLVFFTMEALQTATYKWVYVFIVENIMIFFLLSINFNYTPDWFNYLDQIRFNFVRRIFELNLNKSESIE